jgi:hypothetical protein
VEPPKASLPEEGVTAPPVSAIEIIEEKLKQRGGEQPPAPPVEPVTLVEPPESAVKPTPTKTPEARTAPASKPRRMAKKKASAVAPRAAPRREAPRRAEPVWTITPGTARRTD